MKSDKTVTVMENINSIAGFLAELYDKAYQHGRNDAKNEKKEFDPLGVENINFSCFLDDDSKRNEKYKRQRIERGFDDTEVWNLDVTILKFALPRLKVFRKSHKGHPEDLTAEEWNSKIGSMIEFIESYISDSTVSEDSEGWKNFKDYFFNLWW